VVKKIYGSPLFRGLDVKVTMKGPLLVRAAKVILDSVKKEIRAETAKASGFRGRGKPVPLPRGKSFVDSFSFKIKGTTTIEIISTWPTIENHLSGTRPYKMSWLVQPRVKYVPIILGDGKVIVRTAPLNLSNAWVHPGFVKYTFLERGIRKGKQRIVAEMPDEILMLLLEG
jgi:hypothetical protein